MRKRNSELVVEGLADRRGESGVQEQLSLLFKAPVLASGHPPEHAFRRHR